MHSAKASASAPRAGLPAGTKVLMLGGPATNRTIPAGFLGVSLEYFAIPAYAGSNPSALDPVFIQLIRNLVGQTPVLRIGGDTTDWTWWPVPGMAMPAGVNYALTPAWAAVVRAVAAKLGARLILGINLEADSTTVAAAEAKALVHALGRGRIEALELGNEPELYGSFTWDGSGHTGRPKGYGFDAFSGDFTRIGRALPRMPLAGPTVGAPKWFADLAPFLAAHGRVAVATLHRYPLQLCYVSPNQPNYPTIANLLSSRASASLANSVAAAVQAAHARHVPLRIDEMNTISCGSDPEVAQSFAAALWALDALFEMARVGVDGVNIHSFPGATYELFTFRRVHGRWRAIVKPEYYGLLMFAQAAPPGSHLLAVSPTGSSQVKAWATQAPDHTIRLVVINEDASPHVFGVRAHAGSGNGTLELLQAPSLGARGDVTLGGQGFGANTRTGLLSGRQRTQTVVASGGDYAISVPGASVAMLTLPPS